MPPGFTLSASTFWYEQETDCSKCYMCQEIIVSKMHTLCISLGSTERFDTRETEIKLCNTCMEIHNKKNEE